MGRKLNRKLARTTAAKQVEKLLDLALNEIDDNPTIAKDYIQKALELAMRCNVRLPIRWRNRICPKCLEIMKPGITSRIRVRSRRQTHLTITCLQCGRIIRQPL